MRYAFILAALVILFVAGESQAQYAGGALARQRGPVVGRGPVYGGRPAFAQRAPLYGGGLGFGLGYGLGVRSRALLAPGLGYGYGARAFAAPIYAPQFAAPVYQQQFAAPVYAPVQQQFAPSYAPLAAPGCRARAAMGY